jgi:hypothetical protein
VPGTSSSDTARFLRFHGGAKPEESLLARNGLKSIWVATIKISMRWIVNSGIFRWKYLFLRLQVVNRIAEMKAFDAWTKVAFGVTRHWVAWLLPLVFMVGGCGTTRPSGRESVALRSPAPTHLPAEIPFELRENFIVLQAGVNGSAPFSVALVSGVPVSMISKARAQQLHLPQHGGSWKAKTLAGWERRWSLNQVTFDLGGVKHAPASVTVAGLPVFDPPVDGVLGGDFFTGFVVEIDFVAKKLRLHHPKTYQYPGSGKGMPLRLVRGQPLVEAALPRPGQTPAPGEFIVNTGNPSMLRLYPRFTDAYQLWSWTRTLRGDQAKKTTNQNAVRLGYLPQFQFGSQTIDHPKVMFTLPSPNAPSAAVGTIGNEILSCYNLVFDYSRHRLFVQTNVNFAKATAEGFRWKWTVPFLSYSEGEFRLQLCGASLSCTGPPFTVFRVLRLRPGSAAAQAGLRKDDVLLAIDGQPLTAQVLQPLMKRFGTDGQTCRLDLQRGDERMNTTLKVDWFNLLEEE